MEVKGVSAELELFDKLYRTVMRLRSPDGCPWDKKQTPESLRNSLLEEVYETVDAINENDPQHISEEFGDMLLVWMLILVIYEEEKKTTVVSVLSSILEKIIRRHPHVFKEKDRLTADEVVDQWNKIKRETEGKESHLMSGIPNYLTELQRAEKLQKAAAKEGFDWERYDDVIDKLNEEINELKTAAAGTDKSLIENEIGDLLFTVVNLSRFFKINANIALMKSNEKFIRRFNAMEDMIRISGKHMHDMSLKELDVYWDLVKKEEVS